MFSMTDVSDERCSGVWLWNHPTSFSRHSHGRKWIWGRDWDKKNEKLCFPGHGSIFPPCFTGGGGKGVGVMKDEKLVYVSRTDPSYTYFLC